MAPQGGEGAGFVSSGLQPVDIKPVDVAIIGGGIVGSACAYYLAKAGVKVHLLERGPLGSGASKAGMSHVVTWEEPAAHLALARASQELYKTLCQELPGEIEYRQTGSLAVVEDPAGLAGMAAMLARLNAQGVTGELLSAADLRRLEPGLAPDLAGGAFFPGDGQVNPLFTTQALAQAARRFGAQVSTHAEVLAVERAGDKVTGVLTGVGRIPAGRVVIAAGAWSAAVGRLAGVELPIQPRKGTLIVTALVTEDFMRCKIIISAGYMDSVHGASAGVAVAANIQQVRNGNLLLGSSRQFAGFDLSVDPLVAQQVIARCLRFLPSLARVPALRMWSGLRPYTPDLLPLIGPVGSVEGLYVAAGHEGIGITEGPITGKLISQMITGEALDAPLAGLVEKLSPDRFSRHS